MVASDEGGRICAVLVTVVAQVGIALRLKPLSHACTLPVAECCAGQPLIRSSHTTTPEDARDGHRGFLSGSPRA